jgi:AsmA protein
MPRFLKIAALVVGSVLTLLVLALAVIAATFNPNDYKGTIIKLVMDKTGRTLALPGELKLTFYPRLGAQLGKVSLSERGAPAEFVGVDSAHVSLALLPLLANNVVVDRVDVDGLRANVVRRQDGSLSFDDLLVRKPDDGEPRQAASSAVKFAIDSIKVRNARLHIDDRKEGRKIELKDVNLESGPIANKVDSKMSLRASIHIDKPGLNGMIDISSRFKLDLDAKRLALDKLEARMNGAITAANTLNVSATGNMEVDWGHADVASGGLVLTSHSSFAGRTINTKLTLPPFKSAAKQLKLPELALALDIDDVKGGLKAKGSLAGNVAIDLEAMRFNAPAMALVMDGSKGSHALAAKLTLGLAADLPKQTINTTLKGKLDESTIDARFGMRGFATPLLDLNLIIDKIDADRYRTPATASAVPAAAAEPGAAPAAEVPIDLSALKGLNLNGSIQVGSLRAGGLNVAKLAADIRSGGSRFAVSPISAKLYGGGMSGALNLEFSASDQAPHIALDQTLTGIELGALLKDVMKKAPIDGRGDVQLAVSTRGSTIGAMKRALGGSAKLRLADGSVSGFNLAKIVRDAKAKLDAIKGNAPSNGTASVQDKTDFTELTASFKIAGGVARNDDLAAKTPLFRLAGAGDIDIGKDRLDYLAKATVVATLQGQGGPELEALKGVTLPVRLSGPFTAVAWQIDFKALVTDTVKQKATEKVKDKLKDALKGLFGK